MVSNYMKTSVVGLFALAYGFFFTATPALAAEKTSLSDGWLLERLNGLGEERLYVSASGVD